MSAHKHMFVRVTEITRPVPGQVGIRAGDIGAVVCCLYVDCGEVRHVWQTGEVIVKKEGLPEEL